LFGNVFNWLALLRAFAVISNPARFFAAIARGKELPDVVVRTPTGNVCIHLRNFESLRTLFSIFCRLDYNTPAQPACAFIDVGANIGIASVYFLSRNRANRVTCFEPDRENLDFLRRNLRTFANRSTICAYALATSDGSATLYRAEDGKYSSLIASERACLPEQIECRSFKSTLQTINADTLPITVKIDVEGLELALVNSVDWREFPTVRRLICEATGWGATIPRPHTQRVRTALVEDVIFTDEGAPS
jgi:FkbM family methyltransferase